MPQFANLYNWSPDLQIGNEPAFVPTPAINGYSPRSSAGSKLLYSSRRVTGTAVYEASDASNKRQPVGETFGFHHVRSLSPSIRRETGIAVDENLLRDALSSVPDSTSGE
jgi:hypothetical protein